MKTHSLFLAFISFLVPLILNAQAGQLDPEFSGDGFLTVSFYADQHAYGDHVLVLKDSSLLITGTARVPTDSSVAVLLKYFPDGSPDLDFDGDGKYFISLPNNNAYGTASILQPDDKIVTLVGLYTLGQDSIALFRFNADGTPDVSFNQDGVATLNLGFPYQTARAIVRQTDGKYLIAGNAGNPNENSNAFLARLMPDGKRDLSFDSDGIVFSMIGSLHSRFDVILSLPNGKIIAAGYATFDGKENFVIARYTSSGQLDASFDGDGIKQVYFENSNSQALGGMLLPDGRMVFCGYASQDGNGEFAVVRLTSDGKLDQTFDGDGLVTIDPSIYYDQLRCLVRQPDGKIVLGGYVHSDGPLSSDMGLVRLLEDGSLDNSFDGDGISIFPAIPDNSDGINSMALQPDGKIVVTGDARNGNFGEIVTARFITGLTTATSDEPEIIRSVSVYPNPASDHLVINYNLDNKELIAIQLLNLEGKIMETLMPPASREEGSHIETFRLHQSYPAGHYLVNITTPEGVKAERVTIN